MNATTDQLVEDLRDALADGVRDLHDIGQHVQAASRRRDGSEYQARDIVRELSAMHRADEIELCESPRHPHRTGYRPRAADRTAATR